MTKRFLKTRFRGPSSLPLPSLSIINLCILFCIFSLHLELQLLHESSLPPTDGLSGRGHGNKRSGHNGGSGACELL